MLVFISYYFLYIFQFEIKIILLLHSALYYYLFTIRRPMQNSCTFSLIKTSFNFVLRLLPNYIPKICWRFIRVYSGRVTFLDCLSIEFYSEFVIHHLAFLSSFPIHPINKHHFACMNLPSFLVLQTMSATSHFTCI